MCVCLYKYGHCGVMLNGRKGPCKDFVLLLLLLLLLHSTKI